jgi:AcrR family transcriptional regulator
MARVAAGPSSEERREQIVEAAKVVFARKGFTGATNRDIAQEAGVTPGLIYHYFRDKRDLFEAIIAEHSPLTAGAALLLAPDVNEQEPRRLLTDLATGLLRRLETVKNLPATYLLIGEALRDPEVRAHFNSNYARVVEALASYLRAQMVRGRLRILDPELVAQLFLGSLLNCVIRRGGHGDPRLNTYTAEQIAGTLVDMALDGLQLPSPGP